MGPATDPPDSTELHGSVTPDPEGQCEPSNPLLLPGAEGQSQRLHAVGLLKPESEEVRGRRRMEDAKGAAAQKRAMTGAEETPRTTVNPKHCSETQSPAPAAREAPSAYSGHA
ncbi:hypothetical protein NDU88_003276 [Pleurodeles waltl]|uniref:Uncharacterized protein n=1 Tax=Pleurodeles waltl TaxID=8319 RepID=A0AAV7NP88_PLEWA|nr:hypothetical protein NDU88_003276 [Pleurodeles waltl]